MQTEVFPFTLFALGGMMIFVAANDLLTMFIALEVLSLPLYLMCGLARRRRLLSQEAAVKYFLLGAFASAFFLYGLALLYGYAGSVRLTDIADGVGRLGPVGHAAVRRARAAGRRPAVQGLGRPVPHLDPGRLPGRADARHRVHGAPARRSRRSARILRVLHVAFGATRWEWRGVLWAVAIVSMVIGAVLGLTQTDIKRMVAYSSVAHAGFLLIGAMAVTPQGVVGHAVLPAGLRVHHARGVRGDQPGARRGRRGHAPVAVGGPGEAVAAGRPGSWRSCCSPWPASR